MKKIFIEYSQKDSEYKDRLMTQLRVLELEDYAEIWDDRQIQVGTDWLSEIQNAIEEAEVVVLMISAGFLTSVFIRAEVIPRILERRQREGLIILPLFVKPCAWQKIPWLSSIQGFPPGNKTLMEMDEPAQFRLLSQFVAQIFEILEKKDLESTSISHNNSNRVEKTKVLTTFLTPLPPRKIELIGREKELAELDRLIKTSNRVVLVNGLGGIGKTEVCKAYFYEHYSEYHLAAWVDWYGSVRESLVNALGGDKSKFIDTNEKDTADERFEKIVERLELVREPMLLVFDNIGNPEDNDIEMLLSLPLEIKILASSRSHIEGYEERSLEFLNSIECKELFYRFYKGIRDDELLGKVLELCGYHTLTVELLARTADYSGMSIGTLFDTLKIKGFNLNTVMSGKISTSWHNEREKRTFFDHLLKGFDISGVTEKELPVLVNLSILPAIYIHQNWIFEWLHLDEPASLVSLIARGWIKRDSEYRVFMHPVIGEVVRFKVKPNAEMCRDLILSLAKTLKCGPGDNPIDKKVFLIYGESVIQYLSEETDADLAALANNISTIHIDLGQLDRAIEFAEKAAAIMQKKFPGGHPKLDLYRRNLEAIRAGKG